MNKRLPNHMLDTFGSLREFKVSKRAAVRRLAAALDDFRLGCAYVPHGQHEAAVIAESIRVLKHIMSVKEWGR